MINDDLKIKLRKSYLIVAFVVFLLFSLIQWSITKGSVEGIFSVFFTRLILGQPGTLLSYFVVYPDLHDFISFGFSGPLSLLTREVLHVPAYEIYGYLKSGEFSRPIVYNTISIGDFYAGFGYWGVAFAGIISGFIVNFIHLYLSNAKKTGFTLAAVFTLSLMFSKMNSTNILILLTSWGVLQIFLLTVLLNKLRRFP
jgi:hypothetical protein